MKQIKFGQVWTADLSPKHGTEPGKVRPVLVIQNQALLDADHPSTLIVPLTTNLINDAYPLRIRILAQSGLKRDSDLLIDQLRAIDNKRLVEGPMAQLDEHAIHQVQSAICEIIDFLPL